MALDPGSASLPSSGRKVLVERWGQVVLDLTNPDFLGAQRATNNTGELSAIGYALLWAGSWSDLHLIDAIHIRTDSQWAQHALLGGRIKANKSIVLRIREVLAQIRELKATTIGWVRGHQTDGTDVAQWNERADKLANKGLKSGALVVGEVSD